MVTFADYAIVRVRVRVRVRVGVRVGVRVRVSHSKFLEDTRWRFGRTAPTHHIGFSKAPHRIALG